MGGWVAYVVAEDQGGPGVGKKRGTFPGAVVPAHEAIGWSGV